MTATKLFPLEVWTSQITQASIPANENALRVEVLQSPALSISNQPAPGPNDSDMYVIGPSPSGDFSDFQPGNVVIYKGGTWLEFERFPGWVKTIGGDVYVYQEADGWVVFAVGPTAEPWNYIPLAADFGNDNATLTDVPGWSFTADAESTYEVEVFGAYQTTATSNGLGLGAAGPADSDFIGQGFILTSATASAGWRQIGDDVNASASAQSANTNLPVLFKVIVNTGPIPGPVSIQLRSEVSSQTSTLIAGLTRMAWRKLPF